MTLTIFLSKNRTGPIFHRHLAGHKIRTFKTRLLRLHVFTHGVLSYQTRLIRQDLAKSACVNRALWVIIWCLIILSDETLSDVWSYCLIRHYLMSNQIVWSDTIWCLIKLSDQTLSDVWSDCLIRHYLISDHIVWSDTIWCLISLSDQTLSDVWSDFLIRH